MSFKFFKGNVTSTYDGLLNFTEPVQFDDAEFCYQFDDDEPIVFGLGSNNLTLTINPSTGGNISFNHNNRRFKIFARQSHQ